MGQLPVQIRPFTSADQPAARSLILAGLGDHFGWTDETANLDLNSIEESYVAAGHLFVVAELDGSLVGTGALIEEGLGVGRLVRMSVSPQHRRLSIGRAMVTYLVAEAKRRGYDQVVLETNDDWDDAIGLYRACGFVETRRENGEVHLALNLP